MDPDMQSLNLGVIGNCRTAALLDTRGRLVWWCFPRLDGDPIFSRRGKHHQTSLPLVSRSAAVRQFPITPRLNDCMSGSIREPGQPPPYLERRFEDMGGAIDLAA